MKLNGLVVQAALSFGLTPWSIRLWTPLEEASGMLSAYAAAIRTPHATGISRAKPLAGDWPFARSRRPGSEKASKISLDIREVFL
jgi:hypothetical protein